MIKSMKCITISEDNKFITQKTHIIFMTNKKSLLPKAPVEKIIKSVSEQQGIKRISKEAVKEMIRILEKKGFNMSKQAGSLANHAKRKTIKTSDIELAHIK
jgi:histone H3/H4